jgi:hypothetical protein
VPRYSPLPIVSIDPRNEAELVQRASEVVYDASNQTLNDFSAGNPLAALLEGQAFAQGEFLFWANQLPQKILIEWIGPFLGAMRRLGTPATARLLVTIPPNNQSVTIPAGTAFTTNANLTAGQSFSFLSDVDVTIPAGEVEGYVTVFSQFVGADYNVPANSITGVSAININGLTATNPQPSTGGSDVETFDEVQERFFTLIRRRNPVSAEDWQDFFEDFYGAGTLTSVQPNRTAENNYNYLTDYLLPNGQVSFFVLGPGGVELTADQIARGQNVVNFSVPVQGQGHLYPITLSQVQYDITLRVDVNGSFGSNLRNTSLDFRDRLYQILQPGTVFPADIDPSVSDVNAAFYSTFTETTRFSDPIVETAIAYNTPPQLTASAATYTQVYNFEPKDYLLTQRDLVTTTIPLPVFYSVLSSFTPTSDNKKDQPIYNRLQLEQIQLLTPGQFSQGDVVYWSSNYSGDDDLHVVLQNVNLLDTASIIEAVALGKISSAKTYSPWVIGNNYSQLSGSVYNPQIVQYDYESDEFIPQEFSTIPLAKRPGALVWVVSDTFTLQQGTDNLTGATSTGLISSLPVVPQSLTPSTSYSAGTWVQTPQVGSGPNPVIDPYYNYVDPTKGAVVKYAYVLANFTYTPNTLTVSEYFDELVEQGILQEIQVQNADEGLPIYQYKPRFPVGTYLQYTQDVFSAPEYYVAAQYFTPSSTNVQDLINNNLIIPLAPTKTEKVNLTNELKNKAIKQPVKMFIFSPGERTFFRAGSNVISYTATTHVTPLFDFNIYLANGTFVKTENYLYNAGEPQEYVPYFDPKYLNYAEDTILSEDGKNFYRVMRAFTPSLTVTNWTNTTVANTARIQEYAGNLLRYVRQYICDDDILSQLGRVTSAIKLGVAQITLIPSNSGVFSNSLAQVTYVWENTNSFTEIPQLSWFTNTTYPYTPPNYSGGTLNL